MRFHSSRHFGLLLLIAVLSVVVWSRQISVGGFSWSDAPIHAMDGVFVFDFLRDMPIHNAKEWSWQYYGKYPSLGLIVFYPPFFAMMEACVYAVLGISVFAARFSVIIFGLIGLASMYSLARQMFGKTEGILAAGLWASLPMTVLWSRQVMLEVPTVAMLLACSACYLKYRESDSLRWLIFTAILTILAILTKQWAIFILAFFVLDMTFEKGIKKTFSSVNIIAAGAVLVVVCGYMIFSSRYASLSRILVRGNPPWRHLISADSWLFYLKSLPEVLSVVMIGFASAGILLAGTMKKFRILRFPILWAIMFYLFASVICYKETRYFYLITPAGVLFAVGGFGKALDKTHLASAGKALLIVLMIFQYITGWFADPGRLNDYSQAAKTVIQQNDSKLVLVDAARDGQFIFDMRKVQNVKSPIFTLRGSKLLYSRAARRRWNYQEHIKSESDILKLIKKYGIRYVVVESSPPRVSDWQAYFPPPSQKLRSLLKGKHFRKIASYPISDNPVWKNVRLDVYRYKHKLQTSQKTITIPVPSMGKEVKIHLE